jgi:translation initiation factor IF-3
MMDYGKFKYEQSVKAREARKKQTRTVIKEVQFRPKIGESDFEVKRRRVERFLDEGDKVKCTMRFRGREVTHPEIGRAILQRLFEEVEEMAVIETNPRLDGRQMTMVLAPAKRTRKETTEDSPERDTSVQEISPEASSPEDSSPEDNRTDVPAAAAAADTLGDEADRGGHVPE